MKKIDKLGRIVVPIELRKKYGLSDGAKIEIFDIGDGITIKSSEPFCRICRAKILDDRELPLCDECTLEAVKSYNEKNL